MNQPIQQGGRLGRYQLVTRLATGGMAEVWLGRTTGAKGFQKTIVVKTILPHLADDPDFLRMFIDEALLAAALNHPNIVQIFDLGQIGDHYYIAMEYILGRTMRQVQRVLRKQRKVMPPWLVLRVAVAVCDALDYAHNRRGDDGQLLGIVHRDVTPENIMISFSGVTKVVDFGIAKASTSANVTRAGKIKGKLAYLAPEQILNAGRAPVDRRTDIYALGVLLYEMLTGMRPFRAPNDMALLLKIPKEEPTPPSKIARWVPTRLSNIVMKAMSKDIDVRYQRASELSEDLEGFLTSVGTYPTERHISAYMCKLFDEEERRVPVLGTPSQLSSHSASMRGENGQDDIKGPDSGGSISIEISVAQTFAKEAGEGAEDDEVTPSLSPDDATPSGEPAAAPPPPPPPPPPPQAAGAKPAFKIPKPAEMTAKAPSHPSALDEAEQDLSELAGSGSIEIPGADISAAEAADGTDDALDLISLADVPKAEVVDAPASPAIEVPAPAAADVPAPAAADVPAPAAADVPAPQEPEIVAPQEPEIAATPAPSTVVDDTSPVERVMAPSPARTEGARGSAWDAIVSRSQAEAQDEEDEGDEAQSEAEVRSEGGGHIWDRLVQKARETETPEESAPEEVPPAAEPEEETLLAEGLHGWDAFIRKRSSDEAPRSPSPFASPSSASDDEERERRRVRWGPRDEAQLEAAERFDEGLALIRQGRQDEALAAWERAVELDPTNRRYQGNLRLLKRSREQE